MNTVTTNETKKSDRIVSVLSTRDGSERMRERMRKRKRKRTLAPSHRKEVNKDPDNKRDQSRSCGGYFPILQPPGATPGNKTNCTGPHDAKPQTGEQERHGYVFENLQSS